MATQGPSYGLSREVKMKLKAKYDVGLEHDLRDWIFEVTDKELRKDLSFHQCLKDGTVLCELMRNLDSSLVKSKFPHKKMLNPFRCMENIAEFLRAATEFGVQTPSLFTSSDLYDESNMSQAKSKNIHHSEVGVYVAEKQEKNWSEEELRRGEGIIGLQAGTNKCASQSGMTPYGAPRTVYDKRYTGKGTDEYDEEYQ